MFELHLTCTKDIKQLHLDFTDGSCITQTVSKEPEAHHTQEIKEQLNPRDKIIHSDNATNTEIVDRPKIPEISSQRSVKIDPILNNFEV